MEHINSQNQNTIKRLALKISASLCRCFWPLFLYHLYFSIVAAVFLVPLSAWATTRLLTRAGSPAVSNQELLTFLLSPAGLAWAVLAGSLSLLGVFIHHCGMIHICAGSGSCSSAYRKATAALLKVILNLPSLVCLALIQVAAHLAVASPFLLAVAVSGYFFLGGYDPYYLIARRPGVLWVFILSGAPLLLAMAACNSLLYLRWFLALPVLAIEKTRPLKALRKSASLSKAYRRHIAVLVLGLAVLTPALSALLTFIYDRSAGLILTRVPENFAVLVPAVAIFIGVYILLGITASFLTTAANSLLLFHVYAENYGFREAGERRKFKSGSRLIAWSAGIILLIFAMGQAVWTINSFFEFEDNVRISAHRGSSHHAPENTIPAIKRAIEDGAHYVEIDVRQTADDVPVLFHDTDLRRVAGKPYPVWEFQLSELQRLDAGSWFHPSFEGVKIPTLKEAISAVDDRAKLYIEIKPSTYTPRLPELVARTLNEKNYVERAMVASLSAEILSEIRELVPGLKTSLLVHSAIGRHDRDVFDALSLRAGIAGVRDVRQARLEGYELHVWTVNDRSEMSRFIDMGVDNIITDRPDVMAGLLDDRAQLSTAELLLVKFRNWLMN